MTHGRRATLLAQLAVVTALGVCGTGCQTSALTATGGEALRTARLAELDPGYTAPAPTATPESAPTPPPAFDERLLEPPPTVRGVNPAHERNVEPGGGATRMVLTPNTQLSWSIESRAAQGPPMNGSDVIHPDGHISLGPYGKLRVGGMTPDQASQAIARHVSRWVRSPHVRLKASQRRPVEPEVAQMPPVGVERVGHTIPTAVPPVHGVAMTIGAAQGQTPSGLMLTADPDDGKSSDGAEEAPAPRPAPSPSTVTGYPVAPLHHLPHVPTELKKVTLPPYVIEPPDVLIVEAVKPLPDQDIRGQHAVRPDGTIGLGIYGSVYVAGKTLDQARDAIYQHLRPRLEKLKPEDVYVDVLAYNSKVYYIITDGAGYGEQVYRIPVTGSETVLDALGQINGLPPVASKKKIWVARRSHHGQQILPVDWDSIAKGGATATNYQVLPGDRIYVNSNCWIRVDTAVQRFLSPFERILGATLLGAQTVNSIKGQGGFGNNFGGGF